MEPEKCPFCDGVDLNFRLTHHEVEDYYRCVCWDCEEIWWQFPDGTMADDMTPACLLFFAYAENNGAFTLEDIARYNKTSKEYFEKVTKILEIHGYDLSRLGFVEGS